MTTVAGPGSPFEDVALSDSPVHSRPRVDDVDTTHETVSCAQLSISRLRSGVTIVALAGEIDLCSVETVERTVLDAVAASAGRVVVIDLNGVGFLSARGTATLVAAGERAVRGGGVLRVVLGESAPVARVMRWVLDAGPVFATVAEALTERSGSRTGSAE
ncbi:STAS domain-containing protein [Pseudonocardia parietis]|uniref:Anti-anti-sigma factor n=1 Tax=Pseudonocardia parietis TaxID=570936 RepID=A0ABS4VVF1_9PSEU|nr:STAS domain-containing protein [Pseudonocardia parietis]MBP2367894.1 anti-anti-sigma factor [Pseudonocardia parietis]